MKASDSVIGWPIPRRFMLREEAAAYLCLSPKTLAKWACTKEVELPYFKIGGRVLYDIDDLNVWVEARRAANGRVADDYSDR